MFPLRESPNEEAIKYFRVNVYPFLLQTYLHTIDVIYILYLEKTTAFELFLYIICTLLVNRLSVVIYSYFRIVIALYDM